MSSIKYLLKLDVGYRGLICCVLPTEAGVLLSNYLLRPLLSHSLSVLPSILILGTHADTHPWLCNSRCVVLCRLFVPVWVWTLSCERACVTLLLHSLQINQFSFQRPTLCVHTTQKPSLCILAI